MPSIPNPRACSTARTHATSRVGPSARMRFSPLWPETIQTSPPPSTANAASPIDQPARWSRAGAPSESRSLLPVPSRFMVDPGRLSGGVLGQLDELAHPQDEPALHLDLADQQPPDRLAGSQALGLDAGPAPVPPPAADVARPEGDAGDLAGPVGVGQDADRAGQVVGPDPGPVAGDVGEVAGHRQSSPPGRDRFAVGQSSRLSAAAGRMPSTPRTAPADRPATSGSTTLPGSGNPPGDTSSRWS